MDLLDGVEDGGEKRRRWKGEVVRKRELKLKTSRRNKILLRFHPGSIFNESEFRHGESEGVESVQHLDLVVVGIVVVLFVPIRHLWVPIELVRESFLLRRVELGRLR